jgi:hypothetical protein
MGAKKKPETAGASTHAQARPSSGSKGAQQRPATQQTGGKFVCRTTTLPVTHPLLFPRCFCNVASTCKSAFCVDYFRCSVFGFYTSSLRKPANKTSMVVHGLRLICPTLALLAIVVALVIHYFYVELGLILQSQLQTFPRCLCFPPASNNVALPD